MAVYELKAAPSLFDRVARNLRGAAERGLYSAAVRSVALLQTQEIQAASPRPVDRGIYRAGWRAQKLKGGAAFFNAVPWAVYIERGVPGANVVISRAAVKAVSEWAQRKLGLDAAASVDAAWGILKAAKRRGLFARGEGLRVMEKYVRERLPRVMAEEVAREIARAKI